MQLIIQGIKMEFDKKLTKEEKDFVEYMAKRGFIMTYYQSEDTNTKGSLKDFKVELKDLISFK